MNIFTEIYKLSMKLFFIFLAITVILNMVLGS
jgi:hypothetical protein